MDDVSSQSDLHQVKMIVYRCIEMHTLTVTVQVKDTSRHLYHFAVSALQYTAVTNTSSKFSQFLQPYDICI